jgi:hypothetical protein
MITGWTIWCHKNATIFDGALVSLGHWRVAFKDKFSLILHRVSHRPRFYLKIGCVVSNSLPCFSNFSFFGLAAFVYTSFINL